MARQVLPFVGAAVGFVASGGNPMGAQIGFALGSIVGNAVDPQVIKGPAIGEASLQTSAEGVFRPIVYGTGAVKGNVISRGNRQVKTQRTQQGKGGGPVVEEQRVYWTFAIRLCEATIGGILRIWQDEKLVYDVRPSSPIPAESAEYATRFRLYYGDEAQLPDPDIEAYQGIGDTPAYRGSAYIVFPNFDLTDRRESIPDFRFEIAGAGAVPPLGSWLIGPVAQNGASGGSELFFRATDNIFDLYSGTLNPLPAWMSNLLRISCANGAVFFHGNESAVSFDGALTFTHVPTALSSEGDVYWNGSRYYCNDVTSADGITWTTIPGLTSTVISSIARDSDGAIVVAYVGGEIGVSLNDGSSWVNRSTPSSIPISGTMATNGVRIHFVLNSVFGWYTDDLGITWELAASSDASALLVPYVGGGNVVRKGGGTRIFQSVDNGEFFNLVEDFPTGNGSDRTIEYGNGVWCILEQIPVGIGEPQEWRLNLSTTGGATWDVGDTYWGNGNSVCKVVPQGGGSGVSGEPVALSSIVADLHDRIDMDSSQYNVGELTDMVDGLVLSGDYTAADAVRTLMPVYKFDAAEFDSGTGYRIHYPKRGKPVVTTITLDDIIDAPERTVREDSLERPRALHLHYENPTIGYAPAKATIRRSSPDVLVVGEKSVQIPVSFIDVDAPAQIADRLMRLSWATVGGEEDFVVPDNLLGLVPSDAIGVSLRGQTRRMLITRQMLGAGRISMRMLADRQSAYTSNVTGVPVPEPTPPLPSIVGSTIFEFLDIPALNDTNDSLLWYEAASGQTEAWYGAQTQRKAGAAVEFEDSVRFNQNTIMGTLLDTIPAASEHYTDTTNVVRVQLYTDDVIDSLTDAQFLSEGGSFALKNADDTWEILQYRDADDEGGRIFALSHLARGRLNTGGNAHLAGASFVLLDGVTSSAGITAWIDTDITSRAISFGMSPDGATQYVNEWSALSQTEFPVANVLLERVTDTINVRVVPRHRFGTEDNPVVSVNWIGYRVTATDGSNILSVDTTSPTMSFDVTGWASPVTVTAYQLNRFTGPGPGVSEDIA